MRSPIGPRAMYARRFLGCIVVLTLLFVAGAFAFYQWGGRVLVQQSVPKGHFEQAQAGDGPDYTQSSSWIARPGMAGDPADWLPDGQAPESSGKVAVFYVHPTTYLDRDRWNAPARDSARVRNATFGRASACTDY